MFTDSANMTPVDAIAEGANVALRELVNLCMTPMIDNNLEAIMISTLFAEERPPRRVLPVSR
jgi:hypothetical protein